MLADGRVVTCSSTQEQDLFWAARGAGNAFGVATSFTYRVHDQKPEIWGGLMIFAPTVMGAVIGFANKVMMEPENESALMLMAFAVSVFLVGSVRHADML